MELINRIKKEYFSFNNDHYLQMKGMAMGTRMAASYLNIFMDDLERRILANLDRIPTTWRRYMDDILPSGPMARNI